ncbi:GATA transcription factor 26 isoform X2 [Apium graveolens]|uniref:GATA transcription factor 26 isoform X2 n=1 Tax=Apium graveolens TaxID=4045 RepID=UPI003D7B452D
MGKQGPCRHCGVTSTPLWRNGPPDKPVLCNACGSRWRTKGTLVNYTPLHARAEPDDLEEYRMRRMKTISLKIKEAKVLKRKQNHTSQVGGAASERNQGFLKGGGPSGAALDYNRTFRKVLDEDTSNRSSSGSAISNSESCLQLANADASDLTGPAQSIVWDSMVPSRKRTCVNHPKQSSVEKLTKDLYTILHEQQSYLSGSSEEDLLFDSDTPMVSVEIGHGSVLIRHPSTIAPEEESEASSLSIENKHQAINEAYSQLSSLPVHTSSKGVQISTPGVESTNKPGPEMKQDQLIREKIQEEKLQLLANQNSPLCYIDLKDVLNLEEFKRLLTNDEQQQLLTYLPSFDTVAIPDSLKSMFDSPQFAEDLSAFQKLLAEGVFDISPSLGKSECNGNLKRLVLGDLTRSSWVEHYNLLQDVKCENSPGRSFVEAGPAVVSSAQTMKGKRSRYSQSQNYSGGKTTVKSPKRVSMKANYDNKELVDNDATCFSPKSLFALPPDNTSLMLDSFRFDEHSDQDLLLNVPSHSSFPQAELLMPTSSFNNAQASTSSSSIYQNHVWP